jgi:SNF2 family DNA or RNA helicase
MKPPEGLKTPEAIQKWWQQFYLAHLGAFHKITWHRIILDGNQPFHQRYQSLSMLTLCVEAHIIKNPESKTSIAVRALSAKYKWVLTGTPLHK